MILDFRVIINTFEHHNIITVLYTILSSGGHAWNRVSHLSLCLMLGHYRHTTEFDADRVMGIPTEIAQVSLPTTHNSFRRLHFTPIPTLSFEGCLPNQEETSEVHNSQQVLSEVLCYHLLVVRRRETRAGK